MSAPRRRGGRGHSTPPNEHPAARLDRSSPGWWRQRRSRCRPNERRCIVRRDVRRVLRAPGPSLDLPLRAADREPWRSIEMPRHPAFLDEILEDLLALQRIHRAPKTFVPEGHELVGLDQALEW